MTATQIAQEKAVRGRRVTVTRYSDLNLPGDHANPGIITRTELGFQDTVLAVVRLDGDRSNLHIPTDYEGLHYLDEVTDVPDLPMGRFTPEVKDLEGEWEGVPLCSISEDGDLIALTTDLDQAVRAMNAYRLEMLGCLYSPAFDAVTADKVRQRWAFFEWEPEDAEIDWSMAWCAEGDGHAIRLFHLPA